MRIICPHCDKKVEKPTSAVNRARLAGAPIYCGRKCAGKGRRTHKTKVQKRAEKSAYDAVYRAKNLKLIKASKALYFKKTYDPVKAAKERKKNMSRHVEYCRRPEYRSYKRAYDSRYRANKDYGPFADSFLILLDIDKEVNSRMSDYDVRIANGTINKKLTRRRENV